MVNNWVVQGSSTGPASAGRGWPLQMRPARAAKTLLKLMIPPMDTTFDAESIGDVNLLLQGTHSDQFVSAANFGIKILYILDKIYISVLSPTLS